MKHVLIILCLASALVPLRASAEASTPDGTHPRPQDSARQSPRSNGTVQAVPGKFDLGDVEPGSEHSREFRLSNLSSQPVRVIAAIPTCRCTTTTDISGSIIPAGGSISFTAVLTTPTTPGIKNAKVQITFEGNSRPLVLEIEGDVTMPIRATPPYVGGPKGDRTTGTVTIRSLDGKPFRILSSGGFPPVYQQGPVEGSEPDRSSYTLLWDVSRVQDLPRHLWWVIFTDHPDCPVLPLRIRNPATGSRADMERYDRHWRFDESAINAERIPSDSPVPAELIIKHYNPRARGAVQKPEWRIVRSLRSLSEDVVFRLVEQSPVSDEEVRISFTARPRPGHVGPIDALLELQTETGSGTCQFLAVVEEPRPE